jgi:hypothetical protein
MTSTIAFKATPHRLYLTTRVEITVDDMPQYKIILDERQNDYRQNDYTQNDYRQNDYRQNELKNCCKSSDLRNGKWL